MTTRALLAVLLLLGGCSISGAGLESTAPAAQIIASSLQCNSLPLQQSVTRISGRQQLADSLELMQGAVFPKRPPDVPEIDPLRWNLLLINGGQKPSAGYHLSLGTPAVTIRQRTALLHVVLNRPAPDTMVAAVITHPCMLVKIPAGEYDTIELRGLDQIETIPLQ